MSFSDYMERGILTEVFGTESSCPPVWERPKEFYVALALSELIDKDTGCSIEEPSNQSGYERVPIKKWVFTPAAELTALDGAECPCDTQATQIQNEEEIVFPMATETWGEVNYVAITDSKYSGNVLAYGLLNAPKAIIRGQIFKFLPGDIRIGIS